VKLRVLSSLLLLFFPACQLAAQATSNASAQLLRLPVCRGRR